MAAAEGASGPAALAAAPSPGLAGRRRSSTALGLRHSIGNADFDPPRHKPTFGDSRTSLFDVVATSASALPFELPVGQFLEETCAGMLGAEGDDKAADPESRLRFRALRAALELEAVRVTCTSLFWVAVGQLFGTVLEGARGELRAQLAHSWFSLSLELRGPRSSWVLDMIPVALVQAIFRLLVDAFPLEQERIVRASGSVLDKLTQVVYQEVLGFCPSQESFHVLRAKLFCQNVLDHPAQNQEESMRSELRREKQVRRNRMAQLLPLAFGVEDGLPLEDTQLYHVLETREREKDQACRRRDRVESDAMSPQKSHVRDSNIRDSAGSSGSMDFLFSGFLPLGAEMLSVDRYANLSAEGEEIMERQLTQLYPEDDDGTGSCTTLESARSRGTTTWSTTADALSNSRALDCLSTAHLSLRHRSSRTASSSGSGLVRQEGTLGRRNALRVGADPAERRKREEALMGRLEKSVQAGATLRTVLVSPVVDRLAPSGGDRGLLQKPFFEARELQMRRPRPACLRPLPPRSQSEPALEGHGPQPSSPGRPARAPPGRPEARDARPPRQDDGALAAAKAPRREVLSLEAPGTLKHEVVLSRLARQAETHLKQSFDQSKKDYDMTTGQRKNLNDPRQMEAEEREYVKRVQDMVGKPCSRAPRMLKQNTYALSKGRSQLVRRKEQLLREGSEVTSAIFSKLSDAGSVSILKSLTA